MVGELLLSRGGTGNHVAILPQAQLAQGIAWRVDDRPKAVHEGPSAPVHEGPPVAVHDGPTSSHCLGGSTGDHKPRILKDQGIDERIGRQSPRATGPTHDARVHGGTGVGDSPSSGPAWTSAPRRRASSSGAPGGGLGPSHTTVVCDWPSSTDGWLTLGRFSLSVAIVERS